jgi:hypothetical protein
MKCQATRKKNREKSESKHFVFECRYVFLLYSDWSVQANQENGAIEIDLPFSQHQAPVTRGFLFVGWWVDLKLIFG